jgi:hypothetical protein
MAALGRIRNAFAHEGIHEATDVHAREMTRVITPFTANDFNGADYSLGDLMRVAVGCGLGDKEADGRACA